MEKTSIIKKLFSKKTRDYTYAIAFFFIFSFFIFYVIRPNLVSVFEAQTKIEQLKNVNALYEEQIDKVIEVQSVLESNRDDLTFLTQSIAVKPEVNKILSDVDVSSEGSKLASQRTDVSDINLKDTGASEKLKSVKVNMNLIGKFDDTLNFIKKVYTQRRLKLIPDLQLGLNEKEGSRSGSLNILLNIEGFYL